MTIKKTCPVHGEYDCEVFEIYGRTFESPCPECDRINTQNERDNTQKRLESHMDEERIQHMRHMGIREKYYGASSLSVCSPKTMLQAKAVECLKAMVANRKGTITLIGANGIGKTFFAIAALNQMGCGHYYKMYEMWCRIRATYTPVAKCTELDEIDNFVSEPLLIIDELGKTKASDAELSFLSEVFDDRRSDYKPTILLSNRKLAHSCPNFPKNCEHCSDPICFEHYVGSDILSRLKEESAIFELDGEDRRGVKN